MTDPAASTEDDPNKEGELVRTGADGSLLMILALAGVAVIGGAGLLALRRRAQL